MHFCLAQVAIAGDSQQIVHRGLFSPVSWPEIEVLRFIHGEDAVTDVKPFARVDQRPRDERDRLIQIYGGEPVERCFPGRSTRDIEMEAADAKIDNGVEWLNPITQQQEVVGEAPPEYEPPPYSAPPRQRKAGMALKMPVENPI
jgi:hypothetical protein